MKKMKTKAFVLALTIALFAQSSADACTGIMLKTKDSKYVHGRTLEFGVEVSTSLVVVPRNYEFTGKTNNGDGMKYKTKYAMTGLITFTDVNIADGMNSAGL